MFPVLAGRFSTISAPGKPQVTFKRSRIHQATANGSWEGLPVLSHRDESRNYSMAVCPGKQTNGVLVNFTETNDKCEKVREDRGSREH